MRAERREFSRRMDVLKMNQKMKNDGEEAQSHFLPGTGSAHLEPSAFCKSVVLVREVLMALVVAVLNTVIISQVLRGGKKK